ncbi:winged helix DNA-binding domain-containing protein, partial [bacterium]|nr:winged helix DNA-binding domain-containing protein [bacterium]MBU1024610.1 winged helix DNA-binding domain-containing protein [bacterium]
MMTEIKLTKENAKEFLVQAQMLSGDKLPAGAESVLKVLENLKAIQVDSISVAGTNQEIALNSRIKSFVPEQLDSLLYEDRNAYEYWLKALCILPIESYPYYEMSMKKENPWTGSFLKEYNKSCKDILMQIKKNGPMALSDFDDDRKVPGWWQGNERLAKWLLEALWNSGQVMIHHRKGRIRYFDLKERCVPENKPLKDFRLYQKKAVHDILSAQRLFALTNVSGEVWSTSKDVKKDIQKEFLNDGTIIPVIIKGSDREYFILKEDIKLLDKKTRIPNEVRLIAP